jgi:hypothetical protein
MLKQYQDLLASVRGDKEFHSIRDLVQPDDSAVQDIADVLVQGKEFIALSQDFVHVFTKYKDEFGGFWATQDELMTAFSKYKSELGGYWKTPVEFAEDFLTHQDDLGDYWSKPAETLDRRVADCDCFSILLCSILRNFIDADSVFCVLGYLDPAQKNSGHMWVVTIDKEGKQRIVESTLPSNIPTHGVYEVEALFNDQYAFATDKGIKDFGLIGVPEETKKV